MPSTKFTTNKSIRLTHLQLAVLEQPRFKNKGGVVLRFLLDKLINEELPQEIIKELEIELGKSA